LIILCCHDEIKIFLHVDEEKRKNIPIMPLVMITVKQSFSIGLKVKGKGQTLVIVPLCRHGPPQRRSGTWSTKQRRTYLPYTFPAIAGTHLPTPKGWRVE